MIAGPAGGEGAHGEQRVHACAQVLQSAVCPEVKLGLDSSVSAIASVTEVELSRDMQVAKIYISVYSDPHGKDIAMRGLSRLQGCGTACCPFCLYVTHAPRAAGHHEQLTGQQL